MIFDAYFKRRFVGASNHVGGKEDSNDEMEIDVHSDQQPLMIDSAIELTPDVVFSRSRNSRADLTAMDLDTLPSRRASYTDLNADFAVDTMLMKVASSE